MSPKASNHNAHMLIPLELWHKLERLAILEGKTKTDLVCESIASMLVRRKRKLHAEGGLSE